MSYSGSFTIKRTDAYTEWERRVLDYIETFRALSWGPVWE